MDVKNYVGETARFSPIYKEWIYFLKKKKIIGAWLKDNAVIAETKKVIGAFGVLGPFYFTNLYHDDDSVSKSMNPLIPSITDSYERLTKASNVREFREYFILFLTLIDSQHYATINYTVSNIDWREMRETFLYEKEMNEKWLKKKIKIKLNPLKKGDRNEGMKWYDTIGKQPKNRYNFIRR